MNEQPTYEQVLVQRLSARVGELVVTIEMFQLQIESLTQCLRDNGVDPETLQPVADRRVSANGESSHNVQESV